MEEDYLKKYQEAWQHDADELLDKVAPPMEELLSAVEHRERQRRRHLTAFISGIAAMMLSYPAFGYHRDHICLGAAACRRWTSHHSGYA